MDAKHRDQLGLDQYPSNSKQDKVEDTEAPKERKKIVQGTVKKKKRSLVKRVGEEFLEDDSQSVGNYILYDVLIPAAKDLISDMINSSLEMFFWGSTRPGTRRVNTKGRSNTTGSRVNYGGLSTGLVRDSRQERTISRGGRARHDFDEIIIETRGEAEEVLAHLIDLTVDYNQATVADLYGAVGISSNFTDDRYGWTDLRGVTPVRARGGGYILNLPRALPLD